MMRKVCFLLALLSAAAAHATTYTVPFLTSASVLDTLNTACTAGANNIVYLPAGTYAWSSAVSVPCSNISIVGPAFYPATAILAASYTGADFFNIYGLSNVTITYLHFENTGGIYLSGNYSGITVNHNQFTNLPSAVGGGGASSGAVYLDGTLTSTATNIVVQYNTFGDASSCTAVFAPASADNGGSCAGITTHVGILANFDVEYNEFNHVEEGVHVLTLCGGGCTSPVISVCSGCIVSHNYIHGYHRIGVEVQVGMTSTANFSHNAIVDPVNPYYSTFALSMACCTSGRNSGTSSFSPADHVDDNVLIDIASLTGGSTHWPPFGIEWWGLGATANGNWIGGPWYTGITFGYGAAPWSITNNYICGTYNATNYISNEEHITAPYYPTESGNTTAATCAATISTAPTISPAPGTYSSPQPITLSDAGTNTSIYYTIDGTTPVPGSGSTQLYTAPILLALPATVKAVGMWGVAPEPFTYDAGYGYVPSSVVSAAYSTSGTALTLSSIALTVPGATLILGTPVQAALTCTYSDSSSDDCTSGDAHGNGPGTYTSTNTGVVTISPTGLVTPVAVGTANLHATVGLLSAPAVSLSVTTGSAPNLILGQNLENYAGVTYANYFNSVYFVTGTSTSGYTTGACHFLLYGPVTSGKHHDCLIIAAPTSNTEASTYICKATYTTTSTSAPGEVSITPSGCGTLTPNTAYWVAEITDDPRGAVDLGYWNCGGSCGHTVPTLGAGTQTGYAVAVTYGSYGSLPSSVTAATNQTSVYIDLTEAGPSLVSAYQDNTGLVSTAIAGTAWQQHAYCVYDDGVVLDCSTTDARGNAVTAWGDDSSGVVLSVGAIGGGTPGRVTGNNFGTAHSTCTVTGSIPCTPYQWTFTNNPATGDAIEGGTIAGGTIQ